MLGANVLCMKKRKKRSYCISSNISSSEHVPPPAKDNKRPPVAMMHITEDTPPDMLAGAMDLTIHLPTGRTVKMSVERSTPMMDLLVQITTSQHLQLSGYIIQALGMAPSAEYSDKILPYKPNTPIGALDTQHIKVIPKSRSVPVPKNVPPGHQPFESTFRLKVHLPRNQLYVCRVSRNVRLEEIMKKVCEEKNLDAAKYEFRHPGNLDEVLDPKFTLSDYQITEIYVTTRGAILTQEISTSDIMALRREEERRQMAAKTGGGVFNLIFKRGKTSMGSGSVSSENRSISPTQSDDSRSVSPPTIQKKPLVPPQPDPPSSKPKPPQRKRRPAPKPPTEKPPSQISSSNASETSAVVDTQKKTESTLTICHSRNSSDSSGYHEASILSDNCTTLPRKFKPVGGEEMSGRYSQSTTNLSKMSTHSKSTSSLGHAGRKKKPAPPPPPVLKSTQDIEKPSPVVASPEPQAVETPLIEEKPVEVSGGNQAAFETNKPPALITEHPTPAPRVAPIPKPRHSTRKEEPTNTTTEEKPPEIVGVVLKSKANPQEKTERDLQIWSSIVSVDDEILSILSTDSEPSYRKGPSEDGLSTSSSLIYQEAPVEANNVGAFGGVKENRSVTSLKSVDSLPAFLGSGNMQKWSNFEDLDELSDGPAVVSKWEVGDTTDTESLSTVPMHQSPRESVTSLQPPSYTPSPPCSERSSFSTTIKPESSDDPVQTNNAINLMLQNKTEEADDGFHDAHKEMKTDDEVDDVECDWQYQLPSPPTAFRDASPVAVSTCEPEDSVVTSPELFEKLHQVKNSQSEVETTTTISDSSSSVSEEEKRICNKLSLEHLEKRKSLVYNRELSTSLKLSEETKEKHNEVVHELMQKQPELTRRNSQAKEVKKVESVLPNFVITTYDNPKKKIKVFEDDSVRSNEQNQERKHSLGNNADGEVFKKPFDAPKRNSFSKVQNDNVVARSGSFSTNLNSWKPVNPVKRSKSQLTVARKNVENGKDDDGMSRSNSLFDVSGLHSLEVMRMIQTKLSTPTNSSDGLHEAKTEIEEVPQEKQPCIIEEKQPPRITHHYRPPSINLGTWSERPKTQISVKEDTDYKMKNGTSKIVVNAEPATKKTVEILNNKNNVSIKVNGTEPIVSHSSGNVIIKIGGNSECNYRKPFGTLNRIEQNKPRPHSVAIDPSGDVSRVPIVRSVELKKPFRDSQLNKSVTQIYPDETSFYKTNFSLGGHHDLSYSNSFKYNGDNKRTAESTNGLKQSGSDSNFYVGGEIRPVMRVNHAAPVVRGFRPSESTRKTWNVPPKTTTPFGNVVLKSAAQRNSCPPVKTTSDPRGELLSAIRNFGGKKGLKSVKT